MAEKDDTPVATEEGGNTLAGIDVKAVEDAIATLEAAKGKYRELNQIQAKNLVLAREIIGKLSEKGKLEQQIATQEAQRAVLQRNHLELQRQTDAQGTDAHLRQLAQNAIRRRALTAQLNAMQEVKDKYGDQRNELKGLYSESSEYGKVIDANAAKSKKASAETTRTASAAKESFQYNKENLKSVGDWGEVLFSGAGVMGEAIKKFDVEFLATQQVIDGLSFSGFAQELGRMPGLYDKQLRQMGKSGIKWSEDLSKTFLGIQDPKFMARAGEITQEQAESMLSGIGVTSKDANAALTNLKNNVTIFRDSIDQTDGYTKQFTGNLIAGLDKIGVKQTVSTKALSQFTKVLKMAPMDANKSLKKLVNVAGSLDKNVAEVLTEFTTTLPKLAMWGAGAVNVFAELEAQSVATGLSVDKLNGVAMKLDTFEGAAKAAQGFNAVMGDTLLSVTDLVHAEPHEKIELLRDAMDRSGMSFENANRRVKQMIADMLTGGDVSAASRLFGDENDFTLAKKNLDKTAIATDALKERIQANMNIQEQFRAGLSDTAGGFSQLVQRGHAAAVHGGKGISEMLEEQQKKLGNIPGASEKAVLALWAAVKAGETAASIAAKAIPGSGKIKTLVGRGLGAAGVGAGVLTKDYLDAMPDEEKEALMDWLRDTDAGSPKAPQTSGAAGLFGPQLNPRQLRGQRRRLQTTGFTPEEVAKANTLFAPQPPAAATSPAGIEGSTAILLATNASLLSSITELANAFKEASKAPVQGTVTVTDATTRETIIAAAIEGSVDVIAGKLSITGMA